MTDISKKIIENIKTKQIKPSSKWKFKLRDWFLWFCISLVVIISGLFAGILFFSLLNMDLRIYKQIGRGIIKHIFLSLPYLWILFLLLSVVVIFYFFKRTKGGYRYRSMTIIFLVVSISFLFGSFSFSCGISARMNNMVERKVPYLNNLNKKRERIWVQPQKGLIAGEVIEIKKNEDVSIKDFQNKIWTIKRKNVNPHEDFMLKQGEKVKIMGQQISKDVFEAKKSAPWRRENVFKQRIEQIRK